MSVSEAERERLLAVLRRHAAEGTIEADGLEGRIERVLQAATVADAQAVLADLPPLEAEPWPGQPGGTGRPRIGRGHGEADAPHSDWSPTAERFRDPRSGRVIRVWVDGAGRRHYVRES